MTFSLNVLSSETAPERVPTPTYPLNGNRAEVEAGYFRELLSEVQTLALAEGSVGMANRIGYALRSTDLGQLTANQIRELRQQVQTYAKLIEAQSAGIRSLSAQNKWLRTWKDVATPLIEHLSKTLAAAMLMPGDACDLDLAKCKNLLTAQYEPNAGDYMDLLDLATEFELVPDRLCLTKWDDGRWHFCFAYLPGAFTIPLEDTPELREGFPTCFAGYAWFLAHGSELLERCKR